MCARAKSLPPDAIDDGTVVNAFRSALDFVEIAKLMPAELTSRDLGDYALALGGSLREDEENRQPYQYQSAFWFGTVLHRAGLAPQVPKPPRKGAGPNPDYLVHNGTMCYGVEVKRPGNWRGLSAIHIPKALTQLAAHSAAGAVVVDVTDIVANATYEDFADAVERLGDRVADIVWDSDRRIRRPGFEHVMALVVFARGAFATSQSGDLLKVANATYVAGLPVRGGTLRDHHAEWLTDRIYGAIASASETSGAKITRTVDRVGGALVSG
jgi:hypothetical protein